MEKINIFFICFVLFISYACALLVTYDGRSLMFDGERKLILSGSIHYPRSTPQMWPDLMQTAKDGGLNTIESYVFWNVHEPVRREYDFTGNLDLIRFIKTVQDSGLYMILRIGPYTCAEWNYGGLPMWLHNMPGAELRTSNTVYMNEMQNFTTYIVDMLKDEKLFASQGGPIILTQIENEFGNFESKYGEAGKAYVNWAANIALSLNTGEPWIMCLQKDAPPPIIDTCNGFYCDSFTPSNPMSPKIWTENWAGWFLSWGDRRPFRTAEDVAYAVARFFQFGGSVNNYYMYHGGTNFGRTSGGPYITTTYDYDAPVNEYGIPSQPKYGHLKDLHVLLTSMEKTLTTGNITTIDFGDKVQATIYATENASSCFLSNSNSTSDVTINFQGIDYVIPAWSVSILPDCKNVAYNTAKVNAQSSVIVQKTNKAENEPSSLQWLWRPENVDQTLLQGKGDTSAKKLLDQKDVANDVSDYLWYMTNVNLESNDPIWSKNMSLHVVGTGHIIHGYVNGEYIGSQWAKYGVFTTNFEKSVKLNPGNNRIALLSVTVGQKNYGYQYDLYAAGILGPVEIVGVNGDETITRDLSSQKWSYKIGLNGYDNKYFSLNSLSASKWSSQDLPTNRMLTWYQTTFKAPLGNDPVALDLMGLGKGEAWVNGKSIGRYWPTFIAPEDGCSNDICDYRGSFDGSQCPYACGQPTQRWYHVPRSFLVDDVNTLTLFEEFGGNPSFASFKSVVVEKACAHGYENHTLELSCYGHEISEVRFASFGNPQGVCGSFEKGTCEGAKDAISIMQYECIGKQTCSIDVTENIFGAVSCDEYIGVKRLAVELVC